MPEAGYQAVQVYRSTVSGHVPDPTDMLEGELAINLADRLMWSKDGGGNLVLMASGAVVTSVNVSGGTTGLTYSGGPITGSGTITMAGTLGVANGGSGATTAAGARTNYGATTLGSNLFTITNPSAITFPRFNADNTVSALDAASFRTAIGAGTGGGSVTSVSGTGSASGLSLSGTVTTTGNITLSGTVSVDNGNWSGTDLAIANGGTGASDAATARTNLGATTAGANLFTLANPSAIRYLRVNADNSVTALTANELRAAVNGSITITPVGADATLDASTGTVFSLTLAGSLTNLNLTNLDETAGQTMGLEIVNGGAFTITNVIVPATYSIVVDEAETTLSPDPSATSSYGIAVYPTKNVHIFRKTMRAYP